MHLPPNRDFLECNISTLNSQYVITVNHLRYYALTSDTKIEKQESSKNLIPSLSDALAECSEGCRAVAFVDLN